MDIMPSLGMITVNALAAADSVMIPVQAQYLPAKGIPYTATVKEAQFYNMSIGRYMKELPPSKRSEAGQKAARAFSVFTEEFMDIFKN